MRFDNRVAVVTGGSRGIGFATVRAFLREGAAVILCASRQETADKAVAQLLMLLTRLIKYFLQRLIGKKK